MAKHGEARFEIAIAGGRVASLRPIAWSAPRGQRGDRSARKCTALRVVSSTARRIALSETRSVDCSNPLYAERTSPFMTPKATTHGAKLTFASKSLVAHVFRGAVCRRSHSPQCSAPTILGSPLRSSQSGWSRFGGAHAPQLSDQPSPEYHLVNQLPPNSPSVSSIPALSAEEGWSGSLRSRPMCRSFRSFPVRRWTKSVLS
jgi:hypothetical protein